ncbi:MAG: hypothetical protein ABIK68_21800 [bacterium]
MKLRHLLLILSLVWSVNCALAEKVRVMKSAEGGEVVETTFEEGDNEYRFKKKLSYYDPSGYKVKDENFILSNDYNYLGIEKTAKTYNVKGQLLQIEILFREETSWATGYERIVLFLDSRGTYRQMDVHFKDDRVDKRIYSQSSSYYDLSGSKTRTVYYFTSRLTATTGFHWIIEHYNRKGSKISEQLLDVDGNAH